MWRSSKTIERLFGRGIALDGTTLTDDMIDWMDLAVRSWSSRKESAQQNFAFREYSPCRGTEEARSIYRLLSIPYLSETIRIVPASGILGRREQVSAARLMRSRWPSMKPGVCISTLLELMIGHDITLCSAFLTSRGYLCLNPRVIHTFAASVSAKSLCPPAILSECLDHLCPPVVGSLRDLRIKFVGRHPRAIGMAIGRLARYAFSHPATAAEAKRAAQTEPIVLSISSPEDPDTIRNIVSKFADTFSVVPELKELARTDPSLRTIMMDPSANPKAAGAVVIKRRDSHNHMVGHIVKAAVPRERRGEITDIDLDMYMGFLMGYIKDHRQHPLVASSLHMMMFGTVCQYTCEFHSMMAVSSPGGEIELSMKALRPGVGTDFLFNHIHSSRQLCVRVVS